MERLLRVIILCTICIANSLQSVGNTFRCADDSVRTTYPLTSDDIPADTVNPIHLDELIISADLRKREGNKDIITFTKDMREGTRNTGELLGKVPGVFYNPLSTEIIYRGSKNILVLVDGVEKGEDYIKRLRQERFDKVEITNLPTGMYEGYDAVIDLRTKPLYMGYEGVVLTEAVMSPDGRNGKGKFLRTSRSAGQFTYTRERLNIDLSTGYTFGQNGLSDYFTKEYPMNDLVETTLETPYKYPNKNIRASRFFADVALDYDINSNHSISAKLSVKPSSNRENYEYRISRTFTNTGVNNILHEVQNMHDGNRTDILAGLWYRGRLRGWSLNANATYNNIGYDKCRQVIRSSGYELADDRKVLSRYMAGGVSASRHSNNNKWFFSLSDNFIFSNFRENRLGSEDLLSESRDFRNTFNSSVQYQGNKKFSVSANAGFSVFKNTYDTESDTHVTPKLGVMMMWAPSDKVYLRFNYSLSTSYPPLSALQDYGQFTDSLMYTTGNPNLRTSLNHEISLSTTLFNSFTIEGQIKRSSNTVFGYYSTNKGEIPSGVDTYYTQSGFVNGDNSLWRLSVTYSKTFGSNWQISLTGTAKGHRAKYQLSKSSRILPEYSWYVLYQIMQGSLQFYLSGNMESYNFMSPQTDMWCTDEGNAVAVSKTFMNQRLQILGMWYIPAYFSNGRMHGGVTSGSYNVQYWANNQSRKSNMCQISIVYRFHGGNSVKKYNRQSEEVEL